VEFSIHLIIETIYFFPDLALSKFKQCVIHVFQPVHSEEFTKTRLWQSVYTQGLFGKWRNQVDGRGLKGILGNFDL
jgi:hypothetical protein